MCFSRERGRWSRRRRGECEKCSVTTPQPSRACSPHISFANLPAPSRWSAACLVCSNCIQPSRARGRRRSGRARQCPVYPRYRQRPSTCLPVYLPALHVGGLVRREVAIRCARWVLPAWLLISRLPSSGRTKARVNVIGRKGGGGGEDDRQVRMSGGFYCLLFLGGKGGQAWQRYQVSLKGRGIWGGEREK